MSRKKGSVKTGGRLPGSQNKFTLSVKETVLKVFQELQEDQEHPASLKKFAIKNPVEFYKISARLIPTEVNATISEVRLSVNRKDQSTDASQPSEKPQSL